MKRKLYSDLSFADGFLKKYLRKTLMAPLMAIALLIPGTDSTAQTGEALDFDGSDDRVTVPFLVSGSYTKEAWIYPTQLGGFHNIVSGEATAIYINGFNLAGGNSFPFTEVADPAPLSFNTWYHVAITYNDATKLLSLYKNGTLVDDSVLTYSYGTETKSYLGTIEYFSSLLAFYGGQMDEVRIWNYDRTGAQIAGNMSCNLTGDEPGLMVYYKFNQNTANGTNTGQTMLADSTDKCFPSNGALVNFALTGTTSNWVNQAAPGTGVTGTCAGSIPNINITGNSNCILLGDMTPSGADNTDFGMYIGPPIYRDYVITNTGNTTLNISSVNISGPGAASFSVTVAPSSTVAPGASTNLQITYFPAATGVSNAVVTIGNDDGDEGTFTYAITANSAVLPVELTYFKGEKKEAFAKLTWQTASEQNNKGFEILRSADGSSNWESIGFVAAGTSASVNNYSFTDRLPLKGVNAYRLKQVDLDGRSKLSNIIVLNFTGAAAVISIYPNPVKDKFTLLFNENSLLNTEVKISTATGTVVSKIKLTSNRQQIDLGAMAKGIYLLSFANGTVERIVKQ